MGEKAEFVKDVVAMANNGEQSYLIIGLEDGTFADVGSLHCQYRGAVGLRQRIFAAVSLC